MAFTKYASLENAEVLGIKGTKDKARTASLSKFADFEDYRTEDGYLYARIRAISSRVNKNHDGWPSVELAGGLDAFNRISGVKTANFVFEADSKAGYGYSTFLGKPIFVDHHNSDPDRARGVIVDSKLHVEDHKTAAAHDPYYANAPDNHMPPTWVELLLEIDAKSFPRLAKAIIEGSEDPSKGIDGFSMGCDVERSVCSHCANEATTPDDYCEHVRMKGAEFPYTDKHGRTSSKKSYEDCYGIKFFEISAVFEPADETALLREVRTASTKKTAEAPEPQVDQLKMPEPVDTLREESVCAVCGSDMDSDTCSVCGWQRPPEGFGNPDLTKADPDVHQEDPTLPEDEHFDGAAATGDQTGDQDRPEQGSNNNATLGHVTNDMSWKVSTTHESYTNPATETPVVPNAGPATDEPKSATVTKDHTTPVTSNVRTAENFLAAVDGQRRTMSEHTADAASGAPEAATPDKNVDVDAVGGAMEATNEDASKADAQINVEGEGTTGTADVAADKTESVDQGDEHSKNIEEIHTKTWGNGSGVEKQRDPVGGPAYPSSGGVTSSWEVTALDSEPYPKDDGGLAGGGAVQGTEPADPVGKAEDRVDVLDAVTSPSNNSGETKTWSGTDGNGVTRQQEPVTQEVYRGDENVNLSPSTSSAHIFAAMKLADTEVEMGLTPAAEKFERAAELEKLSPEELSAESRVVSRVKTAGLSKGNTQKQARRMPSLGRKNASVEKDTAAEESATVIPDASIFLPS